MAYKRKAHQSPSWLLKGYPDLPEEPCRWEKFLLAEQIDEKDLGSNPKVLDFIIKYAQTYFVPTRVLKMYGMDCDV